MTLCLMCKLVQTSRLDGLCSPCRMGSVASESLPRSGDVQAESFNDSASLECKECAVEKLIREPVADHSCGRPDARVTSEAMVPLPEGLYLTNGGIRCDVLIGACACGATHTREERARHIVAIDGEAVAQRSAEATPCSRCNGTGKDPENGC